MGGVANVTNTTLPHLQVIQALLHVHSLYDAVVDDHGAPFAPVAHCCAENDGIHKQRFRQHPHAIRDHLNFTSRLQVIRPGIHDKRVIHAQAAHCINPKPLRAHNTRTRKHPSGGLGTPAIPTLMASYDSR